MIIHPSLFLIIGAVLAYLTRGWLRKTLLVALPLLAFGTVVSMYNLDPGSYMKLGWCGFDLTLMRVDKLALVFLHVFTLMAVIGAVYSLHVEDPMQHD
ncbi:MAG TPA: hypothetical protein VIU40_12060, partial [Geobacteraceae bacterium]